MRNLIKLNKNTNMVFNSTISEYIDSEYIYVPIKRNYTILVKGNEVVYKGQVILEKTIDKIYSPVSGTILGTKKMNVNGIIQNTIVIQNDFKEKIKNNRKNNELKLNKENIISRLYEYHFNDLAKILETKKINNLVINGIDDEPYILNKEYIINSYMKEILDITDIIATIFDINNNIITIKSTNTKNVEHFLSRIGTYPNINLRLMEDKYLIGKDVFLLEQLNINKDDSLVIDVEELLRIYNAIKYNKYMYDTFVTIAGLAFNRSKVLKVREGTLLKDIIDNNLKYSKDKEEYVYILNGLMTGLDCDINSTIVTSETLGLTVIPKINMKEYNCNDCGLCYRVCPVKVNPKKALDTHEKLNKCIDCGLCTYICPCHINLRKYLRGNYDK